MRLGIFLALFYPGFALAAGVGDWLGYEKVENALRRRLFENRPACEPSRAILDEYSRLHDRSAFLSPQEWVRFAQLQSELSVPPGFLLSGVIGDFQPQKTSFAKLLGSRFQPAMEAFLMESNHVVNSLNMLAWDVALGGLATRLAGTCAQIARGSEALSIRLRDDTISIESCRERDVPLRTELHLLLARLCRPELYGNRAELRDVAEQLLEVTAGPAFPQEEVEAWLDFVERSEPAPPAEQVETLFRTIFFNPYFLLRH